MKRADRTQKVEVDSRQITVYGAENSKWKTLLKKYFGRSSVLAIRRINLREACVMEIPAEDTFIAFLFLKRPYTTYSQETRRYRNVFRILTLILCKDGIPAVLKYATLAIHNGRPCPAFGKTGKLLQKATTDNRNPRIEVLIRGIEAE